MNLSIPFVPKKPGLLRVLSIGRVSTEHQNIENIEAMHEEVERFVKQSYDGEFEIIKLGERASGMIIDRESIREAEDEIESGNCSVVIVEDISRIYRNSAAIIAFVHRCVDKDTRFIAIGDSIDTAEDNWEINLHVAIMRHGMFIPDTRRRVKRSARQAAKNGGMFTVIPFGFRKLTKEEADSGNNGPKGLRITRDPICTPTIQEMADRAHKGQTYAEISDWLNETGVKPGKYVKSGRWSSKLVREFLRNPLLHGEREWGRTQYSLIFGTGKKRCTRNKPENVDRYSYPELAHLTPEEHIRLTEVMDARGANYPNSRGAQNPRYRIPRSRTVFPRQHCTCGVCGSLMYPVDAGLLRCSKAREDQCWCRVRPKESIVRENVIGTILAAARTHPEFEQRLHKAIGEQVGHADRKRDQVRRNLEVRRDEIAKRIANLLESLEGGQSNSKAVLARIEELEIEKTKLEKQISEHELSMLVTSPSITVDETREGLPEAIKGLAKSSFEFSALMRQLIPTFIIYPVQALNCSQVRARARFMISWSSLVGPDQAENLNSSNGDSEWVTVDLFKQPQHIQDALDLRAAGDDGDLRSPVPRQLGMSRERALRARTYLAAMKNAGLTDPYMELKEKPANASRWRKGNRKPKAEGA